MLAGATRSAHQIRFAGMAVAKTPGAQAPVPVGPALALGTSRGACPAFEARPSVRLPARAPIVDRRCAGHGGALRAVDHVGHARDLVHLDRQRLDLLVGVAALGRRQVGPVTHGVKAARHPLVAHDLGAAVPLEGDERLELLGELEEGPLLPLGHIDERHRQAFAFRGAQ